MHVQLVLTQSMFLREVVAKYEHFGFKFVPAYTPEQIAHIPAEHFPSGVNPTDLVKPEHNTVYYKLNSLRELFNISSRLGNSIVLDSGSFKIALDCHIYLY